MASSEMDMSNDFIAVKIGDVNNTASANLTEKELEKRSASKLYYTLYGESKEKENLIPVFADEEGLIYGFQFSLSLEGAKIRDIIPGSIYLDVTDVSENIALSVIGNNPRPEIYVGDNFEIKTPNLFLQGEFESSDLILYQNEPNPFFESTTISFYLPEAQFSTLEFYDASGSVVYRIMQDLDKGHHSYEISKEDLGTTGLLYYRLIGNKNSISKKMIIME
jgi:hypothetical protein